MSEENTQGSAQEVEKKDSVQQDQFVSKKAYIEKSNDMHKFKQLAREAQEEKNRLAAEIESLKNAQLEEQGKFKELYNAKREEVERLMTEREQEKRLIQDTIKKSALKNELGNVNEKYLSFADLSKIEINPDNTLNSESVLEVANQFRNEHPNLVPSGSSGNITAIASQINNEVSKPQEKSLEEMTVEELKQKLTHFS